MDQAASMGGALLTNAVATLSDPAAFAALGMAVLFGALVFLVGRLVALRVGILSRQAPDAEVLGIGLSTGLILAAALIAALASGGRSSFTPIALALVLGLLLTAQRPSAAPLEEVPEAERKRRRYLPLGIPTIVASVAFVLLAALLLAATVAPSPRAGVQPVEFMDEAFYSILGRDLITSGSEAFYSPSGFGVPAGLPVQQWYHWGELWLAGGVQSVLGIAPSFARHIVVLPLLLLGIGAVSGSIARRGSGRTTRSVLLLGVATGLLVAPLPVPVAGNFFSGWAVGMLFHVTEYGLAALIAPLVMLLVLRAGSLPLDRPGTVLTVAALGAALLPAHIAIGLLAVGGALVAGAALSLQVRLGTGRFPRPPRGYVVLGGTIIAVVVFTVAWGTVTGHAVTGSGSTSGAAPFNLVWQQAIGAALFGGGALVTIPVAWLLVRRRQPVLGALLLGVMAAVAGGAIVWGRWIGEFTMFHAFYGALTLFAAPMAAASTVVVWGWVRDHGRRGLALSLATALVLQLDIGALTSVNRLQLFGPHSYTPIPLNILNAISALGPDEKVGYVCSVGEEIAFWDARLLSIDMHTGRRIIPLCFEEDVFAGATGAPGAGHQIAPYFPDAPQYRLFPTAQAQPSDAEVTSFMRSNGIGYLFVDAQHPNFLVPDAVPVVTEGNTQLLRLP